MHHWNLADRSLSRLEKALYDTSPRFHAQMATMRHCDKRMGQLAWGIVACTLALVAIVATAII